MKLTALIIAGILSMGALYEASFASNYGSEPRTLKLEDAQHFRTEPPATLPQYEEEAQPQIQILDLTELMRGSTTSEDERQPATLQRLPSRLLTLLADLDDFTLWAMTFTALFLTHIWTLFWITYGKLKERARGGLRLTEMHTLAEPLRAPSYKARREEAFNELSAPEAAPSAL